MDHRINHYAISHFLQPDPENQPEQSSDNISLTLIKDYSNRRMLINEYKGLKLLNEKGQWR
ncbi:7439_t:CDS:2 [Entrophospora sp. SA101]|nr:7439_t:CDS:2 [Entrophospora sp. SA101]